MGTKRTIPSQLDGPGLQILKNGSMTGTSTLTSTTFNMQNLDNAGLQIEWTGTPTGTISVLASINNVTFHALTFDPILAQPAGSAGGYLVSLNQVPFPYIQIQYVNSSSTGTLNVWASGKDLN